MSGSTRRLNTKSAGSVTTEPKQTSNNNHESTEDHSSKVARIAPTRTGMNTRKTSRQTSSYKKKKGDSPYCYVLRTPPCLPHAHHTSQRTSGSESETRAGRISTVTTDHCSPKTTHRESRRHAISTRTCGRRKGTAGGHRTR